MIKNPVYTIVSDDGGTPISVVGVVDISNSTATPLAGGATFTGSAWVDTLNYGIIFINVYSDVASAIDGLIIEQSSDGINADHSDEYSVPAVSGKNYSINPYARYCRIRYINGAAAQSAFRLQTIIKGNSKPSSHRIQSTISDDDDSELVKAVISARLDTGAFINVSATESNNLRVTDAESGLAIAKGDVTGTNFIHKFGSAPDFDALDGFVTVWDGADDGNLNEMLYNYSTAAIIDSVSSGAIGDTQEVQIQGLDANYDLISQTVTLNGQTRVALTTNLIRCFRIINRGNVDFGGFVTVYEDTPLAAGIPIDTTKVRAVVVIGNNQTLMAVFTIPSGYTGYMRDWYASVSGAKRTSVHTVKLFARPFNEVFQLKHKSSIVANGTSYIQHSYTEPEVFTSQTDIEIRMNSDEDQADVSAGFDLVLIQN